MTGRPALTGRRRGRAAFRPSRRARSVDVEIERQARCRDQRGSLTHLFFSDDLHRAGPGPGDLLDLHRPHGRASPGRSSAQEPYGVWGGEMLIDGRVAEKRARGRPPANEPGPRLVVDEITGVPIVA